MNLDLLQQILNKAGFATTRHHVSSRGRNPKNATRDFIVAADKTGQVSTWSTNNRNGIFTQDGRPHVQQVWRSPNKHSHMEPLYFRDTADGVLARAGFKPLPHQTIGVPRSPLSHANLLREANSRFEAAQIHIEATKALRAEVGFNKDSAMAFERLSADAHTSYVSSVNLKHWANEQVKLASQRPRGLSTHAKNLKATWRKSAENTSCLAASAEKLSKEASRAAATAETAAKAAATANEAAAKAAATAAEMQAKAAANAAEIAAKKAVEEAEAPPRSLPRPQRLRAGRPPRPR